LALNCETHQSFHLYEIIDAASKKAKLGYVTVYFFRIFWTFLETFGKYLAQRRDIFSKFLFGPIQKIGDFFVL